MTSTTTSRSLLTLETPSLIDAQTQGLLLFPLCVVVLDDLINGGHLGFNLRLFPEDKLRLLRHGDLSFDLPVAQHGRCLVTGPHYSAVRTMYLVGTSVMSLCIVKGLNYNLIII